MAHIHEDLEFPSDGRYCELQILHVRIREVLLLKTLSYPSSAPGQGLLSLQLEFVEIFCSIFFLWKKMLVENTNYIYIFQKSVF